MFPYKCEDEAINDAYEFTISDSKEEDIEILFGFYNCIYEGQAFALFRKGGKFYEINVPCFGY